MTFPNCEKYLYTRISKAHKSPQLIPFATTDMSGNATNTENNTTTSSVALCPGHIYENPINLVYSMRPRHPASVPIIDLTTPSTGSPSSTTNHVTPVSPADAVVGKKLSFED